MFSFKLRKISLLFLFFLQIGPPFFYKWVSGAWKPDNGGDKDIYIVSSIIVRKKPRLVHPKFHLGTRLYIFVNKLTSAKKNVFQGKIGFTTTTTKLYFYNKFSKSHPWQNNNFYKDVFVCFLSKFHWNKLKQQKKKKKKKNQRAF